MKVTKQQLLDTILQISDKVDKMLIKINEQKDEIAELKQRNSALLQNNRHTLDQIKGYIQELEEIRSNYVNSSGQSGRQEV